MDSAFFHFINKTIANPFFDFIMPPISWMASGEALFILAILLIIFCKKENKRSGILVLAGLTIMYYTIFFLKDIVGRPRPCLVLSDVRLLEASARASSFPSGHAARAFLAAVILSRFFGRNAAWFFLAGIICFSRVYVGAHYLSDVLVGAVVGACGAWGLVKLADHIDTG
ncbi:MAG: phosphatase PAP2 family protein [Candidatus Omnitrophica bacterium]|nr:phosphatase PAP2 family protein [Candidatus Omnitrophota bacterium]